MFPNVPRGSESDGSRRGIGRRRCKVVVETRQRVDGVRDRALRRGAGNGYQGYSRKQPKGDSQSGTAGGLRCRHKMRFWKMGLRESDFALRINQPPRSAARGGLQTSGKAPAQERLAANALHGEQRGLDAKTLPAISCGEKRRAKQPTCCDPHILQFTYRRRVHKRFVTLPRMISCVFPKPYRYGGDKLPVAAVNRGDRQSTGSRASAPAHPDEGTRVVAAHRALVPDERTNQAHLPASVFSGRSHPAPPGRLFSLEHVL